MSKKIWALSSGVYSDYTVHALFTTKELAEQAAEVHRGHEDYRYEEPRVEEFYLYEEIPERVTIYKYQTNIWDDGTETDVRQNFETGFPWQHWRAVVRVRSRYVRAPFHNDRGGRLEVWGTDEKAVAKTFSDKRAMIMAATDSGVTPGEWNRDE